jgi:hypothetical protein
MYHIEFCPKVINFWLKVDNPIHRGPYSFSRMYVILCCITHWSALRSTYTWVNLAISKQLTTMFLAISNLVHDIRIKRLIHWVKISTIFLLCSFRIFFLSKYHCHHNITKRRCKTIKNILILDILLPQLVCPIIAHDTILGPCSSCYICSQLSTLLKSVLPQIN